MSVTDSVNQYLAENHAVEVEVIRPGEERTWYFFDVQGDYERSGIEEDHVKSISIVNRLDSHADEPCCHCDIDEPIGASI